MTNRHEKVAKWVAHCQDRGMRIGALELKEPLPELNEPHAIAILRPWVNVGRVGTLVLTRLERHFSAQPLGELARPGNFFDFTRYRPRFRDVAGRRELSIPNSYMTYCQRTERPDFMFFNLREPHALGDEYVDSILEVLKTFNARRYFLIGAMYDVVPHTRPLLISGLASGSGATEDASLVSLQESGYQGPTSITSLISQEARKLGIDAITMLVHLPQYVQLEEDYAGAAKLTEVLSTMYQLPPHLADRERGERQYRELTSAVERNQEVKSVLQQLETQYDARHSPEENPPAPLSPEVERFLRELNERTDEDQG